MPRKIIVSNPTPDRYGIQITFADGQSAWLVGANSDYLLFDTEAEAAKAMKRLMKNDTYSWNCTVKVVRFSK